MKSQIAICDVVLKTLGLLLIVAAVFKGHELLIGPGAKGDLWSWRPFLILQVQFELILGMWLLSGVLKQLAWLVATACFSVFCCVTFYKSMAGAESCGCFGAMHVNPWITLLTIDLPAVAALAACRPKPVILPRHIKPYIVRNLCPVTGRMKNLAMGVIVASTLSTVYLVNAKPVEVNWGVLGEMTPRLAYIRAEQPLETGYCLVGYVSHTCENCTKVIRELNEFAESPLIEGIQINVALIEKPPYSPNMEVSAPKCILGIVERQAEHQVPSPMVEFLRNGRVQKIWNHSALKGEIRWGEAIREVINTPAVSGEKESHRAAKQ